MDALQNENSIGVSSIKWKSKMKFLFPLPILLLVAVLIIYGYNYIELQKPMNDVIEDDYRNEGIDVEVRFDNYVNVNVIVYDIVECRNKAPIDVFRVLLQYAGKLQEKDFDKVLLGSKGDKKFMIEGSYFKKLGREYDYQNPIYTARTFTENVYNLDGTRAYGIWTGGILGVFTKQLEDFNDFIRKWIE